MATETEQTENVNPEGEGGSQAPQPNRFFDRLDVWAGEINDPGRWALMRDVTVFQGKLALDALRDLALSPISIGAAILGLVRDKHEPGKYFYPLMNTGKRSDTVINLFGAADNAGLDASTHNDPSVDELIKRFEGIIVKEYETGGMTAQAKEAIDKAIDKAFDKAQETAKREAENLNAHIKREADKFRS
jgi:hypothetical protein